MHGVPETPSSPLSHHLMFPHRLLRFLKGSNTSTFKTSSMVILSLYVLIFCISSGMSPFINSIITQENVVMDKMGHPMLCDFGLACILHDEVTHAQTSSTNGTLVFTSPEHLWDKRNKMSDIWAFGCTAVTVRPLSSCMELSSRFTDHCLLKILYDKSPYHWCIQEWDILKAIEGRTPPYKWQNPDAFERTIESCLNYNADRRPDIESVVQCFM